MIYLGQTVAAEFISAETIARVLRVVLLLAIGLPVLKVATNFVARMLRHRFSAQHIMLVRKGVFYTGSAILLLSVLRELQFDLTALLGAAGLVGVAVGFASQTSLSNLISGLFLISERPFEVGDVIKIGETTGVVLSIDLLSIKLRTFDNRFVRMPNEMIIKTEVVNITRFPIRRMELNVGVAYKEDIRHAVKVLKEVANKNPFVLDEPEPMVAFTGFGESELKIFIGVWHAREDMLKLRDSILPEIKERLDAEGIEIPFPHRTLYVGDVTKPLPIDLHQPEDKVEKAE